MLFTENRYDRSMEQMMKGIPNFTKLLPERFGNRSNRQFSLYCRNVRLRKLRLLWWKEKRMFSPKMRLLRGTDFRWHCICQRNYDRNNV